MSKIHEKRFAALVKRYKRKYPTPLDDFNHEHFAFFLAKEVAPNVTPSSWRAYRSSYAKIYPSNKIAIEILENAAPGKREKLPRKTSSLRAKKLSMHDLEILTEYALYEAARDPRSKGKFATRWLWAGLLTGLRPHEWLHASLVASQLHVINSKLKKPEFKS